MGTGIGLLAGYSNSKATNSANNAYANEINSVRGQIRDAYDAAQKGWKDYIPELQTGISGNISFANSLGQRGSAYNNYLNGAAANSLGLGYQKATESIAPQLEGETYNLIKNFREETMPGLRSQAIDAGAYGGARDYLTRERAQNQLESQIVAQAAADIANQRAQTPSLLQADANSVANYLNAGTAGNNLLINAAEQQHQADMAKSNYLWDLAMQYGQAMGSSQAAYNKQTNPWISGLAGAYGGLGSDIKMASAVNEAGGWGNAISTLFSDRRLKENIIPVGKLDNGLTVYLFNYKGDYIKHLGLIAQEVQEVIPEAVEADKNGFLKVDYSKAVKGVTNE